MSRWWTHGYAAREHGQCGLGHRSDGAFRSVPGPESNWRHMVLQVMFRAINANSRLKILAKTHGYERQQIVQQKDGEQALPSSFGDRIVRTFSEKSAKRSESRASELHSRSPPRADRPGLALQNPRSVRTWPDDRSVGSVR